MTKPIGIAPVGVEYFNEFLIVKKPDFICVNPVKVCSILRKPNAKTFKIPILVTSVLSRFDSVLSDREMDHVSFFAKPFESSDLIAEVERILSEN